MSKREELEKKIADKRNKIKELSDFSKGVLNDTIQELRGELSKFELELKELVKEDKEDGE